MTNSTKLTISLTFGLVLLVLAHAITLATAQRVIPRVEEKLGYTSAPAFEWPEAYPQSGINWDNQRTSAGVQNTLPVNAAARDEIKRQSTICPACPTYPTLLAQTQPHLVPARTVTNVKPVATKPEKYSIAIFVDSSPDSQLVLDWFNRHPNLATLRKNCVFQAYTPSNLIYQNRYRSQVPPEAFPAMLFCDPQGGLVHSFWREVRPSSADQLVADMKAAYEFQRQVVEQRNQLATPQSQSIPSAIASAALTLGSDCDGPNCPVPREPWLNPDRDRVLPPLFDRDGKDESVEGLLRAILNPGETLATLAALAVLVVLAIVALRRLSSR